VARPRKARRTQVRQIPACVVVILGYTVHYSKDIDYLGTQGHKVYEVFHTTRRRVCVVSQSASYVGVITCQIGPGSGEASQGPLTAI
jgi:hypothetical protein